MPEDGIGVGDVEIELGNETFVLKPSMEACIAISRLCGSITAAQQKIMDLEFDTIVAITAIGMGLPPNNKGIRQKVYEGGLFGLTAPLIRYIANVANGGRPISEEEEGSDDDDENPPMA